MSERVPEVKIIVDLNAYNSLSPSSRTTISEYDYEVEQNDDKRNIRLISPSLIQDVDYAVKRTFTN